MLGRTDTRTRESMYCQTIRTVRDISRDDRARIATWSLRTPTDRLKENHSIDGRVGMVSTYYLYCNGRVGMISYDYLYCNGRVGVVSYARPANSHGLPMSLTGFYTFYSPTAVATVAHGFILAPRFYFHIDSCQ